MRIDRIEVRRLMMTMREPFETSFGREEKKDFLLVRAISGDVEGWGESGAMNAPLYNEETTVTNAHMLREWLIPALLGKEISHPDEVHALWSFVRGNQMAKAALEGAVWDLWAKQQGISLAKALGGEKQQIEVGISIGIEPTIEQLLDKIALRLSQGYRRIKIKIAPGWDVKTVAKVRERFGNIPLMADANSAYRLSDLPLFKEMDEFGLTMIEQPLSYHDIFEHAKLQRELKTPICLDESIHSPEDAVAAIEMGACRVINVKIGRVGGLTPSKRLHDECAARGIPVWCGGMLESGIGRAHNIAITTLPNFVMPGDTAASARYWEQDIIEPEVTVSPDGLITVPDEPGIGFTPVLARIERWTVQTETFKA
jgi:o-succinylbenzoate synthase